LSSEQVKVDVLLDQNVPYEAAAWLAAHLSCRAVHVYDQGLIHWSDADIVRWAAERGAVTITFDEDLADLRRFPLGSHAGIVRIRVDPTTPEATIAALRRLF
jgi:predicted nuclease of predicted toxin-antitoxin system